MEMTRNDMEEVETIVENTLPELSHEFSSPWHFSDVVLVVEGTKFHVHRSTLSIWSPVFAAMFTSQFKERTAEEIPLPWKRAHEVEQLLKVIYFDDAKKEVTETNYEFLLELAREYQMDRVLQQCGRYMELGINDQNCLHRYKIAERFGLEDVMEKCNEKARFKSSTDLEESDDFLELEFESKFKLYMARVKDLEEALAKYVGVCSELVSGYYEEVSVRMPDDYNECDNKPAHSLDSLHLPFSYQHGVKRKSKDFDSSCRFCRKRIDRYKGDIDAVDALHFDDLFVELYDLEHDDEVAKITKKMNVPRATWQKIRFK